MRNKGPEVLISTFKKFEKNIFLFSFILLFIFFQLFAIPASSGNFKSRVLFVSSYHPEFPTFFQQVDGIRSVLKKDKVLLDIEFMDSKRFGGEENLRLFHEYLSFKISRVAPYDAIICGDDGAFQFVLKFQNELFPKVPIVFLGVNDVETAITQEDNPYVTGIIERVSMKETIELMLKLHPQGRQIVVLVDSTPSGMGDLKTLNKVAAEKKNVKFVVLSLENNSFAEFSEKLKKLDSESIVLLLSAYKDKYGKVMLFEESLKLITDNLSSPLYHLWEHGIGHGVLGGIVISHFNQGIAAGKIVKEVLNGKKIKNFLAAVPSPNQLYFDFNEMKKFRLSMDSLPENAKIINAPTTFYSVHKRTIEKVVWFIAFLVLIMTVLTVNMLRLRKAKKDLRDSERFLKSVFENLPLMIYVKSTKDFRFIEINKAAEELLGISRVNIIGKTVSEIFPVEIADYCKEKDDEAIQKKALVEIPEGRIQTEKFGERIICTKKIPILDENGAAVYLLGISEDITEQKESEKQKLELEAELWQAQKMQAVGCLAGGIAHDFNNILTAILGYGEIVLDSIEPESSLWQKQYEVVRAGNRAKELVKQILTFSRHDSREKKELKICAELEEALKLIRASIPTTIEVRVNISQDTGYVLAAPSQIHQIVMNICTNAYQAMKENGGVLTVDLFSMEFGPETKMGSLSLENGKYAVLKISDTGCGMDVETKNRIFEPYFSTKEKNEGTGIGLALVHGIVENCNGEIIVESKVGEGTTFKIYFPEISPSTGGQPVKSESIPLGTEKILVVDDEEHIVHLEKLLLEKLGYKVTAFCNPIEALEEFISNPEEYDALITDMTMPGMTGAELAKNVMLMKPDQPIIMCTGYSDIIDKEKATKIGIREFAIKPISSTELARIVRSALDSKK